LRSSRIPGPLMDRIDLHIEIPALPYRELSDEQAGDESEAIRARVRLEKNEAIHGKLYY